jgi:uncharacterized membrane protein YkvA (DUF1232 family)
MTEVGWVVITLAAAFAGYAAVVLLLALAGRRTAAAALARLIPDCAVLFARLLRDPRIPRRRKLALAAVAGYLAFPIDLVPDFIPVVGQLDDAIVVALALGWFVRRADAAVIREHWRGSEAALNALLRLLSGRGEPGRVDRRDGDADHNRADHDAPDGGIGDGGHGPRVAQAGR